MRLLFVAVVLLPAGLAVAEEAGRYAVEPSFDGFVRLDTQTGAASHCTRKDDVWTCNVLVEEVPGVAALSEDVAALRDELVRLAERTAALQAATGADADALRAGMAELAVEVEALGGRLAAVEDNLAEAPPSEDGFFDTLRARLFALVGEIKRGRAAGS